MSSIDAQIEQINSDIEELEFMIENWTYEGRRRTRESGLFMYNDDDIARLNELKQKKQQLIQQKNNAAIAEQFNKSTNIKQATSSTVQNTFSALSGKASGASITNASAVSSITNKATNATSAATSALSNELSSITGNIGGSAAGAVGDITGKVSDILSGSTLSDTIGKYGANAQQLVSSNISGLIGALPTSATAFTKNLASNDITKKLTDIATKATSDFNQLTSDLTGLTSNGSTTSPLVFAASATKKMIESVDLPFGDLGIDLDNLADGTKSKLKELAGGSFDNPLSAIKTAKENIQKNISGITGKGQELLSEMKQTTSSVLDPIKSTVDIVQEFTDPNNIKSLVSESLNFLPSSVSGMINDGVGNIIGPLDEKLGKIKSMCDIEDISQKFLSVVSLGGDYNQITDSIGNAINGLSNNETNADKLSSLYDLAKQLCPNVEIETFNDWGTSKDLYDILVKELLDTKAAKLLADIIACASYFDDRTKKILQDGLDDIAKAGDPYMARTIQNAIGNSSIADTKKISLTLGTNLKDATKDTVHEFFEAIGDMGLKKEDLVSDDTQPNAISAQYVTLLSRQEEVINTIIPEDTRNTVLQVYQLYA